MTQATSMAESFDLVLLYGPTFGGRKFYIEDHLKESHVEVIPRKVFQSDSNIGLRDLILNVIVQLKENKKIVVNDENCNRSTWESYVNMVKKKVPTKTVALVSVLPKHGLQQLYWSRQFEMTGSNQWQSTQDRDLTKWFDSTFNISYHTVDEPVAVEGLHIFYEVYPLTLQINIQANIPALFLQWEAVFSRSGTSINPSVLKTCQLWAQKCHNGRIFIFLDLTKKTSSTDLDEDVGSNMKLLVKKLEDIPIYLYCVDKEAVKYAIPPNPGLLATIQISHGVDLQNKNTVLLYHDQVYSKLAEMAGVQFVNASKIFQKPTLVLNKLIFTSPRQPDFLQDMRIKVDENGMPSLPLYELRNNFHDNCISHEVNPGIKAFFYASSLQSLEKFKKKFEEYHKHQKNEFQPELQRMDISNVSSEDDEVIIQNRSVTRELPKWMLGSSRSSSSSLSSHRTDSVNSTVSVEVKVKSTVYVMSEQELVEVATDILKQAGREDILKRIQERKSSQSESLKTPTKEAHVSSKKISCSSTNNETLVSAKKRSCSSAKSEALNSSKKSSCTKHELTKKENDTKSSYTTTRQSKSKKNLDDKFDTSHISQQTKTTDILDLDWMDTDSNVKSVHFKGSKNNDTVVCNDTSNMETLEISPKHQSKRRNFKYLHDDSVYKQTKQINSLGDGKEVTKSESKDNVTQSTSKKIKLTDVSESEKLPALTKGPLGNFHVTESSLSTCEPSLNIDPTELFQNLDDTSSKSVTLKTSRKQRTEKNTYYSSTSISKKPDLSFLDDIFG